VKVTGCVSRTGSGRIAGYPKTTSYASALKLPSRILQQLSAPFRTVELTAILVGRGSHGSQECTPHRIRTAESAGGSDLFEALVRTLQLPARRFGSHLQDIVGWRFSQLAREHALEIANAHGASVCQLLHGQVVCSSH